MIYHIGRLSYSQEICVHIVRRSAEYKFVELMLSPAESPLALALALVPKYGSIVLSQHSRNEFIPSCGALHIAHFAHFCTRHYHPLSLLAELAK